MIKNYKQLNNLLGWVTFAIAAIVYSITIEPTASFWDCGEFISTSYKLLVGHPPGAPIFMIIGRFFTLFAPDTGAVAFMINMMSALSSAFTILFLFWTITHLAKKVYIKEDTESWKIWGVMGAGFVGALAYTFSDTFWFSAVEGEVYAMSSLFTALVFWAILKWEDASEDKFANRWLILIAYLMGLSIGVHLLNLLAIPAIVLVYYYKKYEVNQNGIIKALGVSAVLLLGILYGIIPNTVRVASWFELLFVNKFGAPFNTGVAVYIVLLLAGIIYGIYYTQKKQKVIANTLILGITVILIGYSSFAMIVIRSSANPTMDQNSPDNVFSLMSYLNREQYGDRPLFVGQYYNSPIDRKKSTDKKGSPIRIKKDGKYVTVDHKPEYVFNDKTTTIFPRMYSREQRHIDQYKWWSGYTKGNNVQVINEETKEVETVTLPTFWNNLTFFVRYQVVHMYFRYFMWNFAGRQNDIQGNGEVHKGNWISGISVIDNVRLGDQDKLPEIYKKNKARNKYYMLPLILGILGMVFQYRAGKKGKQGFWVVLLLFFLTGLAIVLYLNQTPLQPRERDYAYAGSFYAFTIWIGFGVLYVIDLLKKFLPSKIAVGAATLATLVLVPGILLAENWDDHNRSDRYTARDLAFNYLDTCDENAIIFTNGDNDTFPLWYAQEVEGYRTDIRVCNLSYLQTDWYIDQMKRKAYKSDPMPFSLTHDKYVTGTRDMVHIVELIKERYDLKKGIDFLASDNPKTKQIPGYQGSYEFIPGKKFKVPVDSLSVINSGLVNPEDANELVSEIEIDINKSMILKNELMVMDLLANNNWERPIYFAVTVGPDNFFNLQKYFQLEGFAYKIVPIKTINSDGQPGRVATEKMYNKFVNEFKWGGFDVPGVYLDENHQRMAMNIRNNMSRLANALIDEGKKEKAMKILDMSITKLPVEKIPHNYYSLPIAEGYYKLNEKEKGDEVLLNFGKNTFDEINYFTSLSPSKQNTVGREKDQSIYIMAEIISKVSQYGNESARETLCKELTKLPFGVLPEDKISLYLAEGLYLNDNKSAAEQIINKIQGVSQQLVSYYQTLPQDQQNRFQYQYEQAVMNLLEIQKIKLKFNVETDSDSNSGPKFQSLSN